MIFNDSSCSSILLLIYNTHDNLLKYCTVDESYGRLIFTLCTCARGKVISFVVVVVVVVNIKITRSQGVGVLVSD